ncbi:unnamed protein product [Durusdinium trenchii]|uniref:Uncharacterized protein n=1 Tax=Durusdinium trenchii TaxID=1381693 RepID=A0ABP0IK07_9DINO
MVARCHALSCLQVGRLRTKCLTFGIWPCWLCFKNCTVKPYKWPKSEFPDVWSIVCVAFLMFQGGLPPEVEASFVESDGQLHKCKLRVEFDAWPGWLVWVDQRSEWMGSCQLASINLLAYGYASKACTLSKEAAPENSFSVHTTRSTFNFVFAGDAEFFSLLPVLSRLCAHVQGWPVAGSVSSRAELVRWHGWCKVQQSLRLRKAGR